MRRVLVPFTIAPQAPLVGAAIHSLEGLTMGTTWSVKLVADANRSTTTLHAGIQQQLNSVVAQMSTWEPDSNLSCYNQAAANTWHEVPDEFLYVLRYALEVAEASAGAYDPTSGPLVNAWGFGPRTADDLDKQRPDDSTLQAARARVGWQRIQLNIAQRRVFQAGGVYLDFSAIAKGFAVDQISRYLLRQGIEHHLVEVGGELRGMGIKPDAMPWWVELEQPLPLQTRHSELDEAVVALHGWSVATSGDYRRYFDVDDQHYSHTIDPRSGEPIQHGVAAVTLLHPDCIAADALSTALNVMGVEAGMAFATERALPARFVVRTDNGFAEHLTPAFQALMQ
ncbi:MAG: FAD:protein FMN transferase [Steroidobacteraceae bacterium]